MTNGRIGGASGSPPAPRRTVFAAALVSFGGLAGAPAAAAPAGAAFACSCPQLTAEQAIGATPAIFAGRPVEVRRWNPPGAVFDIVTATVEVSERWKGEVPDRVAVHGHTSGPMCGYAHFPPGEPQLFLAFPLEEGDALSVSACSMAHPGKPGGEARAAFVAALARYRAERDRVDEAVAAAPPGDPEPLLDKARFFEDWREWRDAAETYAEAARSAPDLPAAHLGRGRALFASRRFDAALAPLRRALDLRPADPEAARLLGQARFHLGDRSVLESLDFSGLEARGLDLSGRDLRGRDFSGAWIERARFAGADIRGADFAGARVTGSMAEADLRGTDFRRASAPGVDFAGARLDGGDLAEAGLPRADFRGASLRNVAAADANFDGASLAGADLRGASFAGARFRGARLAGVDFADARLVGAAFDRADLRGADLSRADLRGASFAGARYDCRTRFPRGFAPRRAGMVLEGKACRNARRR